MIECSIRLHFGGGGLELIRIDAVGVGLEQACRLADGFLGILLHILKGGTGILFHVAEDVAQSWIGHDVGSGFLDLGGRVFLRGERSDRAEESREENEEGSFHGERGEGQGVFLAAGATPGNPKSGAMFLASGTITTTLPTIRATCDSVW